MTLERGQGKGARESEPGALTMLGGEGGETMIELAGEGLWRRLWYGRSHLHTGSPLCLETYQRQEQLGQRKEVKAVSMWLKKQAVEPLGILQIIKELGFYTHNLVRLFILSNCLFPLGLPIIFSSSSHIVTEAVGKALQACHSDPTTRRLQSSPSSNPISKEEAPPLKFNNKEEFICPLRRQIPCMFRFSECSVQQSRWVSEKKSYIAIYMHFCVSTWMHMIRVPFHWFNSEMRTEEYVSDCLRWLCDMQF